MFPLLFMPRLVPIWLAAEQPTPGFMCPGDALGATPQPPDGRSSRL